MKLIRRISYFLVMGTLIITQHAEAATCTASAQSVAFGSYSPFNAIATDSTGQVSVSCTTALSLLFSYTINLSTGGSGSYSARKMTQGGYDLNYNLYTDLLHATVWGDGTGGSLNVTDTYLLAVGTNLRSYTVYGRISPQQNVPSGSFSDSITVTVNY